jgi:hypothetical protein
MNCSHEFKLIQPLWTHRRELLLIILPKLLTCSTGTYVFTSDSSPHYACKPDDTPNEIQAVLKVLDVTKATGSDGIPARLLKKQPKS